MAVIESDWLAMLFVDDMLWIKNISLQLQGNPFSSWVTMYTMGLSFISYSLHGRRSKGKRKGSNLGARPRAREKGGEESVPLPPFSRALKCFSRIKTIPSLPFWMSSTAEKEEYVFTCNIEILVFYVWSKLSIKDNQSNSMYKSCPLFFLTKDRTRYVCSFTEIFPYSLSILISHSFPFWLP